MQDRTGGADARPPVRGLKRVEFEQLIDLGAFEDEPIELLDGELVVMSPQGETHAWVVAVLARHLSRALGDAWMVYSHSGLAVSDWSLPEPDVAVVAATARPQRPRSAVLVVEVSRSRLAYDLGPKARAYARGGVPTYWVVDLVHRAVHVHTDPIDGEYRRVMTVGSDATLTVAGLPEVALAVATLLPEG
ncbi:MAG: Uma2 family endonuclease [Myxococcales bacterium]|nr:Uma2 family endonuclease [Myxococcales bacterium]